MRGTFFSYVHVRGCGHRNADVVTCGKLSRENEQSDRLHSNAQTTENLSNQRMDPYLEVEKSGLHSGLYQLPGLCP